MGAPTCNVTPSYHVEQKLSLSLSDISTAVRCYTLVAVCNGDIIYTIYIWFRFLILQIIVSQFMLHVLPVYSLVVKRD